MPWILSKTPPYTVWPPVDSCDYESEISGIFLFSHLLVHTSANEIRRPTDIWFAAMIATLLKPPIYIFVPSYDLWSSRHIRWEQNTSLEQTFEQLGSVHWHRLPYGTSFWNLSLLFNPTFSVACSLHRDQKSLSRNSCTTPGFWHVKQVLGCFQNSSEDCRDIYSIDNFVLSLSVCRR